MDALADLAELAVLVAVSLVLVARVVLRPLDAGSSSRALAIAAREETSRKVLGPTPTREAAQIYRKLLRDARHARLVIDWKKARYEQMTMRPQLSLVSVARSQLDSRRPGLTGQP